VYAVDFSKRLVITLKPGYLCPRLFRDESQLVQPLGRTAPHPRLTSARLLSFCFIALCMFLLAREDRQSYVTLNGSGVWQIGVATV